MPQPICWVLATVIAASTATARGATLEINVVDGAGAPLPCRVHLQDERGKPQRAAGLPFWKDHFVCPGSAELMLKPGVYTYAIERGPEYRPATGSVEVPDEGRRQLPIQLLRIADLAIRGWWSGDLHVHRAVEEMPLHLRAEDLHVAPVITWWNTRNRWRDQSLPPRTLVTVDGNRFFDVMGGEDEREAGALLFFGLPEPLPLPGSRNAFPEHPSTMQFVELARQQDATWIDLEKPFWWDAPVWLASGQVDSIGLANNHMCRSSMYQDEAWGKPRDAQRLPPPLGNGHWTQEVYYHVLNCGLRIPPSAGSASGVLPNPVGYDRVYVHTDPELSYSEWWQGLKAGRCFVTNGPLLLCRADGQLPGHVFQSDTPMEIEIHGELASNDHVPALDIVQDGAVVSTVPLTRADATRGVASVKFDRSGWFLVRAVTDRTDTFRFASTGPFYVEIGDSPTRISRRSVQFFVDWLAERGQRVRQNLKDPAKLRDVLVHHDNAKRFWQDRLKQANAD